MLSMKINTIALQRIVFVFFPIILVYLKKETKEKKTEVILPSTNFRFF